MALNNDDLLVVQETSSGKLKKLTIGDLLNDVPSGGTNTLQEVTDAGNTTSKTIFIGGTLPSAPNITLKNNGLGEFTGGVQVTGGTSNTVYRGMYGNSNSLSLANEGISQVKFTFDRATRTLPNRDGLSLGWYVTGDLTEAVTTAKGFGTYITSSVNAIPEITHFQAAQQLSVTGGVVKGFSAEGSLKDGTTASYGFYSAIIKSTGPANYGFYAAGDAPNCFAGSVGIGTDAPQAPLDVNGTLVVNASSLNTESTELRFGLSSTGVQGKTAIIATPTGFWGKQDLNICLNSENSNTNASISDSKVVISNNGNVGIGTDVPQAKLDVNGDVQINKPSDFWSGSGTYYDVQNYGNLASQGAFAVHLTSNGYRGADSKWVSLGANNNTGAAQIHVDPLGFISFNTEADKATGDSSNVTRRMTITADGNAGIGTTDPQRILHIEKTGSSSDCEIRLDNPSGEGRNIALTGPGSQTRVIQATGKSDGNALAFYTGAREDVRFDSDGNVGIGIAAPTASLHVYDASQTGTAVGTNALARFVSNVSDGDAHIQLSNGVDHSANIGIQGGANIYFATDGVEHARILANGNVLIGGTLPSAPNITLKNNGTGLFEQVGIGVDNPERKLHVSGPAFNVARIQSTQTGSRIEFQDANTGASDTVSIGSEGNDFQINTNVGAVGGLRRVTVKADGNVGIGLNNPGEKLSVDNGNIEVASTGKIGFNVSDAYTDGAQNGMTKIAGATPLNLSGFFGIAFGTNSQEQMRIDEDGNVGIGNDAPQAKLDVNGNIIATSFNDAQIKVIGSGNCSFGVNNLIAPPTGTNNTTVGANSLKLVTSGERNVAIGSASSANITEGNNNVAVGTLALNKTTTGGKNVALGFKALTENVIGENNIAVGNQAGYYIEGSNNTIIGTRQGSEADATLNDTIILCAGNTERLRIDSTGSLLFGGPLPAAPNITLSNAGKISAVAFDLESLTELP